MENNKSYFGEIGAALKTLGTGLKVTMKEYFTPKSTEQYPEIWLSNKAVLGAFVTGLLMEFFMVYYVLKDKEVEVVFEFNGLGDWVIYDTGDSGFFSEEAIGIAALYSYGT